jgi:hypothetical protein
MPFGVHKGTKMADVPADYLLWLLRQTWIKDWKDMHAYLVENQDALLLEDANSEEKQHGRGFESIDEYERFGRD